MSRWNGLVAGVFLAASWGCGGAVLQNAQDSPEALSRAVLDAVARRDIETLRQFALTEQEFREQVWPELPASRPERNLPFGYVWTDLRTKSEAGLAGILAAHGGRTYKLEKVMFDGGTTQYASFLVHRDSRLSVRDDQGQTRTMRLFGAALEKGRRFKVFSYVVD